MEQSVYEFGGFRLDAASSMLYRNGEAISLPPKAVETLLALVRRSGEIVPKNELMSLIWTDSIVEESNLSQYLHILRKTLGETEDDKPMIETLKRRGYRFNGDVKVKNSVPRERRSRSPYLLAGALAIVVGLALLGFSWWTNGKNGEPIASIAVLPFVNVGGDPELEYLSDGLSETLIDRLSELPQLKVIARNSSFKFRDEKTDVHEVAQALGVEAIVTGRIARRGDDLNIRVELIDARDNKQIWGDQFVRGAADLSAVEAEIARHVSDRLRLKLSGEQERQLTRKGTNDSEAYDLVLKGDFLSKKWATRLKALECYEKAIFLDPNYALAHARLATTYQILGGSAALNPKDVLPMVQAAAQRAIALDNTLAEAHLALAQLAQDDWDWTTAEREYQLALELNPNLATVHQRYSFFLSGMGQHDRAIAEANRATELDPQQISSHFVVCRALLVARRFDETIAATKKLLELDPIIGGYQILGSAYACKGIYEDAIAAYKEAGDSKYVQIVLGTAYARSGERKKALAILHSLESSTDYVALGELAILHEALGDREKALETLEKAYAIHDLQLQYLKAEPFFDSMHDDARFRDLVRRVGLPL